MQCLKEKERRQRQILCSCSSICKSRLASKSNFSSTAAHAVAPCEMSRGICLRWLSIVIFISVDIQSNSRASLNLSYLELEYDKKKKKAKIVPACPPS